MLVAAPGAKAACSAPADPNVDWSGCDKSGANLKEANLEGATRTDGRKCAEGSISICK